MRVLLSSNSPHTKTGYGTQTHNIAKMLWKFGHEVGFFAWYGLQGGMIRMGNSPIYPRLNDPYGADAQTIVSHWKPDVVITLQDVWVLPKDFGERLAVPWIAYTPVDSTPLAKPIKNRLLGAMYPLAFTNFGLDQMHQAGIDWATMIPHAIDTDIFCPGDKQEARAETDLPQDRFVVSMVAANSSWPSRKGFPEAFLAFKQFKRDHPDAVLYLHTAVLPVTDGFNLQECAELSGLTNEDILIANQADYAMGFPDSFVASIYRASDVLLAPSMGEGFGLPLVEAQACGCPVITLNFSAMPEIIFNGILTEPLQPFYVPTGAWQAVPDIKALFNALEQVYNWTPEYRQQQAEIGVNQVEANYSLTAVAPLWDALMKRIPARAHEHEWATTGIVEQNGNRISLPCLAGRCAAANLVYRDGRSEIVENVYPLTIDGIDIEVDDPDGISRLVCREAVNVYNLDKVELNPEGIMFDVGAHAGIVSAYLGAKYPRATIYAFEPAPANYARLRRTIEDNGLTNVIPVNAAITGDGRKVYITDDVQGNSGGGHIYNEQGTAVESFTLRQAVDKFGVESLALLKLDCEGAEWEIIPTLPGLDIEAMCAEFHTSGNDPKEADWLLEICKDLTDVIGVGYSQVSHPLPEFVE